MKPPFLALLIFFATLSLPMSASQANTINYSRVVDLSHVIAPDMPLWPGDPAVEFVDTAQFDKDGYFLRKFTMGEHSGTHMNAPNSFHKDGMGIDRYEPQSLVVQAVVIDIRKEAQANADYVLTEGDILIWESKYGKVPKDSVVLLYTGWQEKWSDPKAFFNKDAEGKLHFPGFDGKATSFLLKERGIKGVGIDTHGVDPGLDLTYQTNTQVLAQNGIILECLTHIDQLPATGTTLVLGILRLKGGSGTPLSVMAFVP